MVRPIIATMLLVGCAELPDPEPYPAAQVLRWTFDARSSAKSCGEISSFTGTLPDLCDFAVLVEGFEVWCRSGQRVQIQPSPVEERWVGVLEWHEHGCDSTYDVEGVAP